MCVSSPACLRHLPRPLAQLQGRHVHAPKNLLGPAVAQLLPVPPQRLLADDELEASQEAEADFQPGQLDLADAPYPGDLGVRVRQVLERLHGDAQPRQDQPVGVALRHRDGALLDGQPVDVERRGEVDGRAHGAEPVQPQQVLAYRDRRLLFAVELARDGAVLEVDGPRVGADNDVRLRVGVCVLAQPDAVYGFRGRGWHRRRVLLGRELGRHGSAVGLQPVNAARRFARVAVLPVGGYSLGLLPRVRQALLGARPDHVVLFDLHARHLGVGGRLGRRRRGDVARHADQELDAGAEEAQRFGGG